MENLSEVAVKNLVFLSEKDAFLANQYKLENKKFVSSDEDNYDTIYSFSDLEYPLYFTFHQVMNHIHSSYESTIHGYTREQLINFMGKSMISLLEYYENVEEIDETFEILLDDLEEKVFMIEGYYKYGWFLWVPTKLKEYMNYACLRILKVSREITDEYIQYLKDPLGHDDTSSDDETDLDNTDENLSDNECTDNESTDNEGDDTKED